MTSDIIPRNECPLCGAPGRKTLFPVRPQYFCDANHTIDKNALAASGLLALDLVSLVECNSCGMVYGDGRLADRWLDVFWNRVFIAEHSKMKIFKLEKKRRLLDEWLGYLHYLQPERNGLANDPLRVIDYGCGWGDFLFAVQSDGVSVLGVEIDPRKTEFCRTRGIDVVTDLDGLQADQKFDFFRCVEVLEHLHEPSVALQRMAPYLDAEFVGLVSVPNYGRARIQRLTDLARGGKAISDKDLLIWDHLNYFSPKTLGMLLSRYGMELFEPSSGKSITKGDQTAGFVRFASNRSRNPGLAAKTGGIASLGKKMRAYLRRLKSSG